MHNPNNLDGAGDHLPLAERWRRLRAAYRMANLATHHVLGFAIKTVLFVYFVFALAFLFLRYAVLPNIDYYKADIERIASRAVGNPVSIQRVYATWTGLRPSFFLGDVMVRDRQGRPALTLPSVSATMSWWSLPAMDVRFESLEIIRPDLDVRRAADGKLYVAGLPMEPAKGEGKASEWVLRQRGIAIREGRVRWTDEMRGVAPLELKNVTMVLRNGWISHHFALTATPPSSLAQPLDVRARFVHPRFARRISDMSLWKGELYADLRNADLAAWKQYVDYPFELTQGRGSLRAWLSLDHARLAGFTADLSLADVAAQLGRDLPPLELARVSGRLSAREELNRFREPDGRPTFGANGHTVSLDNLSMQMAGGEILPPMTMSETWRPATKRRPERTEVRARMLDLHALAQLAGQLPLSASQRQMLADFAPRGRLVDFSADWDGRYPQVARYRARGRVEGLGISAQPAREAQPATAGTAAIAAAPAVPGFDNLTGSVDASSDGGRVRLASRDAVLHLPTMFEPSAMPFDRIDADVRWERDKQDRLALRVESLSFAQGAMSGSLTGRHVLPGPRGRGAGVADLHGTLTGFNVADVGRYLPLRTSPALRNWLSGALEAGTLHDGAIRLRGDLAHFPFRTTRPGEKPKGEFRVAARIENGQLNYVPGAFGKDGISPLWPVARGINGTLEFDRSRLEIRAQSLATGSLALQDVTAVIPDLLAADKMLSIEGAAAGSLQGFVDYMADSPVLDWTGKVTRDTRAHGNARLDLKLLMPLGHLRDTKVDGSLQLQGNTIALFPDLPAIERASGRIQFNERGFSLPGLRGNLLGGPLTVTGGTQRDRSILVRLAGSATAEGLKQAYPAPAMQRLATRFNGGTAFNGTVSVRNGQLQVLVESSLSGLGMTLPAPLNKAPGDALPLRFSLTGLPSAQDESRDEIRIGLGQLVNARYLRRKVEGGPWRVMSGGIGVNNPAPETDSGLVLNVNLRALNVDHWTGLGREIAGAEKAPASTAGAGGPGMAQYVVPDVTAARADTLVIGSRQLDEVVVGATHGDNKWQASIDSRQIAGYLTWDEPQNGQGLGKITARLSSLVIPESAKDDVKELLVGEKSAATASIPALDVVAERLVLFNKQLGHVELLAHNSLVVVGSEWRISKLEMTNPDGVLNATGRWVSKDGDSLTQLTFKLDIADAGRLLDRLGFPGTLKRGKGKLEGEIAWQGLPYSLDIPTLSGKIDLDLGAGQFLKQDPGAAKLLGVLSLQMLPRMLKLDFRDVFSEGLAFDGITAGALIQNGVLSTNNLKMHGVAATVLMDGTADIANETTNLHVVVIPEFNLGTGPLVYAVAVNPAVGLTGFLAQLFLREPMMKALTYRMQVTGPWKAPVITKLGNPKGAKG